MSGRAASTVALCTLLAACNQMFYVPSRDLAATPEEHGVAFIEQFVDGAAGERIHAWHLLPQEDPKPLVVVHFHGNFGNVATHLPATAWLAKAGYPVVMFDYCGYGRSSGEPSREQTHADGRAVLRSVLADERYRSHDVVVFAQSLGGAIALPAVAAELDALGDRLRGVVVEGSFDSYRAITRSKIEGYFLGWLLSYPLGWLLVSSGHDPVDAVPQLTCALVFAHAVGDELVPFARGRALADAANDGASEFWQDEGDRHLGFFDRDGKWRAQLLAWLAR